VTDRLAQLEALSRDLARALGCHIETEAKRTGVAPSVVCPCHGDELARADALLVDDDPEPTMDDRDPVEELAGPEPEGEPWDV